MKDMPVFHSQDALSTITESTRMDSGDESGKSDNKRMDAVWSEALKRHLPTTMARHLEAGKQKPKAKGQKKSKSKAKAIAIGPSGASSSK